MDSDESDSDELEELKMKRMKKKNLRMMGQNQDLNLGTVLRRGRTSSSSSCRGVVYVAKYFMVSGN